MSDEMDLNRRVGELTATVTILSTSVDKLEKQVEDLIAMLNQGRGAKYMLVLVPATIGLLSSVFGYFGIHAAFTNTGH